MSALTSLLLLNYVAKQLPQLVGKELGWTVIAEFIVLSLPFTVAMTLPMAVLVSTLHAFSRLAADSEITACKASGMALPRLMAPVIASGLVLSLIMVWFNDQVMPAANYQLQTLSNDIARKKPTFALRPQVINQVSPVLFLRAGHLASGSSEMRDVTIYDFSDNQRRRTIRAKSGHVELSRDGRDLILSLTDGSTTEVSRLEPERLQRVFFRTSSVKVRGIGNDLERNTSGGEKSDREKTVCELEAQMQLAVLTRDSVFKGMGTLDSTAARTIGNPRVLAGSGTVYCRMVRAFRRLSVPGVPGVPSVAQAHAATLPSRLQDSARVAIQNSSATIPPAAQAPAQSVVPPAPTVAPSSGEPSPDDLAQRPMLVEGMKLQLANSQRIIDGNQVEIEKKFAIATACMVFALLGAPIAFRFPRGGVGMTIGVSLGVFGVYYCGLIAGEELARRGHLPAFVAMWATNAILLAIGLFLTARLGHEGTTTRGSEWSDQVGRWMDRLRLRMGSRVAKV